MAMVRNCPRVRHWRRASFQRSVFRHHCKRKAILLCHRVAIFILGSALHAKLLVWRDGHTQPAQANSTDRINST